MPQFQNNPGLKGEGGEGQVKRYVHQPLTIEHYGLHAKIQENGRVLISGQPEKDPTTGDMDFDEVEVPASLIFKLATLLKATRTIKYVSVTEAATLPKDQEDKD
jgi:hypothetical protein